MTACQYFLQGISVKINSIKPADTDYTTILTNIDKKPDILYFLGALPEKRIPSVAIVGTRKPTQYGAEITMKFARELAQQGVIIVSGLALGTDALAHKGCLEVRGTTIAVLANELPSIYPRANTMLAKRILEHGGAIISEHSTEEKTHYTVGKWSFLERNRIVAGLADAVLITEASARSGTLNTAAHALSQGKDVFVVPGNITSPQSAGCNALIKQGATPVTCVEDILPTLHLTKKTETQQKLPLGSNNAEKSIIQALANGIRDGEELQKYTKLPAAEYSMTLTMLELNGSIHSLGANQWSL